MRLKTNLIVGVIFLGLLGFVYFYEVKGGDERKEAAAKAKELLSFSDHEASRLVLDRGDTLIVLEKEGDHWKLKAPVEAMADQDAVERLLRNLRETERERVIEDSAQVATDASLMAKYKLDAPRLKVVLETTDGPKDTLLFGGDSPTERFSYVQQTGPNPQIITVRAWRFDNLDKGVFDLRDRRVLVFDSAEVQEIRLSGGQTVLTKNEAGEWHLAAPVQAPADADRVSSLLSSLSSANAEGFVAEELVDDALSEYGLGASERHEISLLVGVDRAEKRLEIGREESGGLYFARDLSRKPIMLVDSTTAASVAQSPDDLRDKKLFRFDSDGVDRIEVRRAADPLVATKDTAEVWHLTTPQGRKAKSWKLNTLVSDIADIEVERFEADGVKDLSPYGLEAPRLRVVLSSGDEVVLEVMLGKEKDHQVYLAKGGTNSVFLVNKEIFDDLDLSLDDVSQPPKKPDVQPPKNQVAQPLNQEVQGDSTDKP
jgi:hypothetical protein